MNFKLSDILIALIFAGLIIGTFLQTQIKNEALINMLLFGLLTLKLLFAKHSFKTSIPFYILLGTMVYINIFELTNIIIFKISPEKSNSGFIDINGERHATMQMNWLWGVFSGLILSPLTIVLYHKKIQRNKILEISLTTIFIVLTAIIYIKKKL